MAVTSKCSGTLHLKQGSGLQVTRYNPSLKKLLRYFFFAAKKLCYETQILYIS
jgi:hypothetical protein